MFRQKTWHIALSFLISTVVAHLAKSQTGTQVPDSNVYWLFSEESSNGITGHLAYFFPHQKEDTTINAKNYIKTYKVVDFGTAEYFCAFRNDSTERGLVVPPGENSEYTTYELSLSAGDSIDSLIVFTSLANSGTANYVLTHGTVEQFGLTLSTLPNQPIEFQNISIPRFQSSFEHSPFNTFCCDGLISAVPVCTSQNDTIVYSYQNQYNQDIWIPEVGAAGHCVDLIPGMENHEAQVITIYPNPAMRSVVIELGHSVKDNYQLQVLDFTGSVIIEQGNINRNKIIIDVENIPSGLYHFRLKAVKRSKILYGMFVKI